MPEGSEVTVVARQLHALLGDGQATFVSVSFVSGRYAKKPFKDFTKALAPHLPLRVQRVSNKGKFLSFALDGERYVGHSFGLTGRWVLYDKLSQADQGKTRMLFNFVLTKDNTLCILAYLDQTNYGYFTAYADAKSHTKKLNTIGPTVSDATLKHYYAKFVAMQKRKPDTDITEFLMKQQVVSGVGNYLKCDILHEAQLSPLTTLRTLTVTDVTRLFILSQQVYAQSIAHGGSPLYTDIYNRPGRYVFKIYNNANANQIKTADGRKTYTVHDAC